MNNKKTDLIYTDVHIESDDIIKTMVQFIQASREFLKYHDACLRQKAETSMIKFLALMILENKSGKTRPSELARLSQTKRHNITTLIRRMEKEGYINIRRKAHNMRTFNVLLTEEGKAALAHGHEVGNKMVCRIMDSFSEDNLSSFSSQLSLIMNNTRSWFQALAKDRKRGINKSKKTPFYIR